MKATPVAMLLALALTVAPVRGVSAQTSLLVPPGTRIRITLAAPHRHVIIGQFVEAGKGDVAVRTSAGGVERVPVDNIARLQRSIGRSRRPGESAVAGMFIGAVIGMLTGPKAAYVTVPSRDPSTCPLQIDTAPACASTRRVRFSGIGAARGAGIGIGAGALIGTLIKTDTWRSMLLEDLPRHVSLVPAVTRHGLGVSITF